MKFLLDTNVVSEVRRKAPNPKVLSWMEQTEPDSLAISVLTLGEIVKGAESLAHRDPAASQSLYAWLEGLRHNFANRILGIDDAVSVIWGRLCAIRPLPVIDSLLAASALAHDMTIVTRNTADFERAGVRLYNPWTGFKSS